MSHINIVAVDPGRTQGRLTLASGYPDYRPVKATPTSTDTSADTTTFTSDPGWTTGTAITPDATGGGLTNGTVYYVNRNSATVYSYHTTLANAESGASKVNLTASITAAIVPVGVGNSNIKFTPYKGDRISLYDGSKWVDVSFTEQSVAAAAGEVYAYLSSGACAIETGAAAAGVFDTQNGVLVKTGSPTRKWLGSLGATTADFWHQLPVANGQAVSRTLWNYYNQIPMFCQIANITSHTYNSATFRQWNNDTAMQATICVGVRTQVTLKILSQLQADTDARVPQVVWGTAVTAQITTDLGTGGVISFRSAFSAAQLARFGSSLEYLLAPGSTTLYVIEGCAGAVSSTFGAVLAQIEYFG